jgi:hypothetical protein
MPIGPRGERLPYPGDPGYRGPQAAQGPPGAPGAQGPAGGVQRRRRGGRPPNRQVGGLGPVAPAQRAMHQPAQVGPEWAGANPMGLGAFGAMGRMPGVGQPGAVDPRAVLNTTRRRQG